MKIQTHNISNTILLIHSDISDSLEEIMDVVTKQPRLPKYILILTNIPSRNPLAKGQIPGYELFNILANINGRPGMRMSNFHSICIPLAGRLKDFKLNFKTGRFELINQELKAFLDLSKQL